MFISAACLYSQINFPDHHLLRSQLWRVVDKLRHWTLSHEQKYRQRVECRGSQRATVIVVELFSDTDARLMLKKLRSINWCCFEFHIGTHLSLAPLDEIMGFEMLRINGLDAPSLPVGKKAIIVQCTLLTNITTLQKMFQGIWDCRWLFICLISIW